MIDQGTGNEEEDDDGDRGRGAKQAYFRAGQVEIRAERGDGRTGEAYIDRLGEPANQANPDYSPMPGREGESFQATCNGPRHNSVCRHTVPPRGHVRALFLECCANLIPACDVQPSRSEIGSEGEIPVNGEAIGSY